ncbi:MAG: glycosyltransferase [Bryobacteraceae bacterium]|jgi:glycosyltransferase involved in cell wall biosynthesis
MPETGAAAATRPLVLIPAYRPGEALLRLVQELAGLEEIGAVIVVDDGSEPEHREIFRPLARIENVRLLRHVVNLGKGAALKTGLNYAACEFPHSVGVVTADADGQHCAQDILRVAAALAASPGHLVLGARTFDSSVPFRSRFGNTLTRSIMRAVTGQKLSDTQTGLRGIPMGWIPDLLKLRATGYDFELDMLVSCRQTARPVREVAISTIYLDGNRGSHFNPLLDSMRIYFVFARFLAASLTTAGIDNLVFILALSFWPNALICQIAGRLVAGSFQFTAGKYGVFHSKAHTVVALPKYWLSVAGFGALSYVLIQSIVALTAIGIVSAKLCAETALFFLSFVVQRDFVFAQKQDGAA